MEKIKPGSIPERTTANNNELDGSTAQNIKYRYFKSLPMDFCAIRCGRQHQKAGRKWDKEVPTLDGDWIDQQAGMSAVNQCPFRGEDLLRLHVSVH